MGLVDEGVNAVLELCERLLRNGLLVLLGLEIAPREQGHEVLQFPASEFRGEGDAQHVGVGRIVDVVIDVGDPLHLVEEFGFDEGLVALLDFGKKFWGHGEMAEIVDGLAQHVAAVGLVHRDFGHGEIGLGQWGAGRVHADEDFGHGLDIQIFRQLDDAHMVVDDAAQLFDHFVDIVSGDIGVGRTIGLDHLENAGVRGEDLRHIRQPCRVFADGRVGDLECLVLRIEGDLDLARLVVVRQHFLAEKGRHERRDALLAVDEDALANGDGTVFQFDLGIAPGDQVAHRISLIQGVKQVADFGRFPDERALDFRDCYLAGFHPGQERFDWVRGY